MASSTALSCFRSSSLRELADFLGVAAAAAAEFDFVLTADNVGDKGLLVPVDCPGVSCFEGSPRRNIQI